MPGKKDRPSGNKEIHLTNAEKHVILRGDLEMRRIRAKQARKSDKKPLSKNDS